MSSLNQTYESAAKDIEQEKKMVAALKRMSIGQQLTYDPDLPPPSVSTDDSFDLEHAIVNLSLDTSVPNASSHDIYTTKRLSQTFTKNQPFGSSTSLVSPISPASGSELDDPDSYFDALLLSGADGGLGGASGAGSGAVLSRPATPSSASPSASPSVSAPASASASSVDLSNSNSHSVSGSPANSVNLESANSNLLWVPANMHPQVNPEKFKMHVKSTMEEIMERQINRKKSLSRKSSLSSSSLPETESSLPQQSQSQPQLQQQPVSSIGSQTQPQQLYATSNGSQSSLSSSSRLNVPLDSPTKASSAGITRDVNPQSAKRKSENLESTKRYSNPSLRELSTELERLSKMAGIDASDAVTLARTLSSNSIGYTSVERLAMDELGGVNPSTPNNNNTPNSGSPYSLPSTPVGGNASNISPGGLPYSYYHNEPGYTTPETGSPSQDFALKRSRRLDYRTLQRGGGSGTPTGLNDSVYNNNSNTPKRKPSRESQYLFRVKPRDASPSTDTTNSPDKSATGANSAESSANGSSYQYQGGMPNKSMRSLSASQQKPGPGQQQPQQHYSQRQPMMGSSPYPAGSLRKASPNQPPMVGGYPTSKPGVKQYQKQQQLRQMSQQLPGMNVNMGMGINPNMNLSYPKQRSKLSTYPKYPGHGHSNPQQQGFPPQQQGYPPQQQAYPQHQQAYPVQQQGYPGQQQHQHGSYQGQGYLKQPNGHRLHQPYPISSTGKQQAYPQQAQQQPQPQGQQMKPQNVKGGAPYGRSSQSMVPGITPNSQSQLPPNSSQQPQQISPRSRRQKGGYAMNTRYHTTNPPGKSAAYGAAQSSINQNLDLLRSEINEFKETLNKTESPNGSPIPVQSMTGGLAQQLPIQPQVPAAEVQQPQQVYDKNHPRLMKYPPNQDKAEVVDISFDTSMQDVSYEDTLGIEQEVLKELELEHQRESHPLQNDEVFIQQHADGTSTPIEDSRLEKQLNPLNPYEVEEALDPQKQRPSDENHHTVPMAEEHVLMDVEESKPETPRVSPVKKRRNNNAGNALLHSRQRSDEMDIDSGPEPTLVSSKAKTHAHNKSTESASSGRVSYEKVKKSSESKRSLEKSANVVSGITKTTPAPAPAPASAPASGMADGPNKTLKMKKSWGWLRERSASFSSIESKNTTSSPTVERSSHGGGGIVKAPHKSPLSPKSPTRSVSSPEISSHLEHEEKKAPTGKENMITKLFKKKKTSGSANANATTTSQPTVVSKETNLSGLNSANSNVSGSSSITAGRMDNSGTLGVPLIYSDSEATLDDGGEARDSDYDSEADSKKRIGMGIFKKKLKLGKSDRKPSHHDKLKNILSISQTKNDVSDDTMNGAYSNASNHHGGNVELDSIAVDEIKDEPLSKYEERTDVDQIEVEIKDASGSGHNNSNNHNNNNKSSSSSSPSLADVVRNNSEDKENIKSTTKDGGVEESLSVAGAKPADKSANPSTLDIQEKIKKSIKRTSRANQPIQFTDSAFGFPLPPPSQSTLIMLDYRFPVHVERAIYRLSHLKLANPKRSLREQVLLSNFMYAYLNLVDHTLHLEQQQIATPSGTSDTDIEEEDESRASDKKTVKGEIVSIDLSVVP